jgi:hypothetical protein
MGRRVRYLGFFGLAVATAATPGCVNVPASGRYQEDGRARIDSRVGKADSDKPVRVGVTRIEDAVAALRGPESNGRPLAIYYGRTGLFVHPTDRRIGLPFGVVDSKSVTPLSEGLGGSDRRTRPYMLVLEFDASGVVTASRTLDRDDLLRTDLRSLRAGDADRVFGRDRADAMRASGWLKDAWPDREIPTTSDLPSDPDAAGDAS